MIAPWDLKVASAASGNVCPVYDAAESFVVGVVVAPDDVPADHAGLLLVGDMVSAVEREVPQAVTDGLSQWVPGNRTAQISHRRPDRTVSQLP